MCTWASTSCSASFDVVCSPWTECKPGQKESVSGNAYQPLPDRASCFPTSVCEEPFIETILPTLTTDRLCSCDTLTCNKLVTQLFEEMVCADPTDEQLDVVLDVCCSGQGEDGICDTICQMDAYEARRSCPGCTDTCECSAGFILVYDADSADCRPCDGVTEFSPSIGGSKCEPIEECECGQEEVSAPTRSSDRVCRDCSAGTIDSDSDGSTGSHDSCSSFTCCAGTHHHHDSDPARPRARTSQSARSGFEEMQAMTLLISDRICDECPERKYKAVSGQGVPCLPVTTTYDAGEEETAEPTPTSDRVCSQCELGATFKPVDGQAESCRPVTQCGPDEEEIRFVNPRASATASASTFPRMAVSKCEFGTFQSQAPTLDSDRECTECSECPSGRFEIRACSALEHVQCAGCSACPPNTYILHACDSENDVSCQQCSTCSDEQYQRAMHRHQRHRVHDARLQPVDGVRAHRLCHLITKCDPGKQRMRAFTPTSDAKCEPCPIGTTDHDRNPLSACQPCPYGHYVPAGYPGSCEQFLCPAGTADLDRNASTRRARRARLALTLPRSLAQRDCTTVAECDLGYEEMVRPAMRPTIFTDRQCHRCIEGLFYRDSNTDFSTRHRPRVPDGPHVPQQQHVHLVPAHAHDREPQASARRGRSACSTMYELVSASLVNDRECQRVRSREDTEYERRSLRGSHRACVPAYSVSLVFDAKFNVLAGRQSRRGAFEPALGSIIATVASLNEDFTARLFNRSVSGDVTVMGSTASPCEADVSWTTRPFGCTGQQQHPSSLHTL
ncbi:hypothetical protein PTSG_08926 [Salpingoeca rosetta]|uniref:TNFR-Cys domain-containing protein n=1 Tax=Salpingoeca rosetta (strain ATCC 50818 / BSB-021) TaxID=946362 RepID=F2ULP9_SALR5|nr:uncharacterized protein PTSG_08926 [Salpingoeca rosetta]EGD78048.1 hypothetical protein PTSG_08926 [Salpingoeca rosetta]|eukprot:XP_004989724.1 hypothetical protein PTSG_08926 [Salpingoeca rosetta]